MVGGIKTISSGVKSTSSDMFLDSTTMSAPCAMKRVLKAAAQVERAAHYSTVWYYSQFRIAFSATQIK